MDAKTARIAVLGTGGTIASATKSRGGVEPGRAVADMLTEIERALTGVELIPHQVTQVASSELGWAEIASIRSKIEEAFAEGADGVVVTQGTDAIEEVAFALDLTVDAAHAPVVVTGAMRNPTALGADGAANLASAVRTAMDPQARGRGCLVVHNDEIHLARRVQKVHTSNVAAFSSPDSGPVGTITEDRVWFNAPRSGAAPRLRRAEAVPGVALLKLALGDDGRLADLLAEAGYRGCVVEALGGGHSSAAVADRLERLAADMPVVLASRTRNGAMLSKTYSFVGSEQDLLGRGLISAGRLDGLKARVLLSVLLAGGSTDAEIRHTFATFDS